MEIKGILYEVGGELKIATLSEEKMQIFLSRGKEQLKQSSCSEDEQKVVTFLISRQVTSVADVLLLGEDGLMSLSGFGRKSYNILREMLGFAP